MAKKRTKVVTAGKVDAQALVASACTVVEGSPRFAGGAYHDLWEELANTLNEEYVVQKEIVAETAALIRTSTALLRLQRDQVAERVQAQLADVQTEVDA